MDNIFNLINSKIECSTELDKLFLLQLKYNLNLYGDELTDGIIHAILDKYINMYKSNIEFVRVLQKFKQFDEIDNDELEAQVLIAIDTIKASGPSDLSKLMHVLKTSMSGSADGRRVYQKASYLLYHMNKK